MASEMKFGVLVFEKSGEKVPKDGAAYFVFIPRSSLPQGMQVGVDGTMDIENVAEKVIHVELKLESTQARWDNQAHNLRLGTTAQDDPKNMLWISPDKDKPKGPWAGGKGFSDFKYDHAAKTLSFTIDKSALAKGSYAYGLAVKAETLSGPTVYTVRDDPQIKNGNTFSITWIEGLAVAVGFLIGVLAALAYRRLFAARRQGPQ
ncbi:hypothetical protein [Dokdonella sp.]|uniref:hypothetical protein n=1 Tax=Dokdonella sp. TaxID=2291710 RepID=UPI0035293486